MRGPITAHLDLEVRVALARILHDQFEGRGNDGADINQEQSVPLVRALKALFSRPGGTSSMSTSKLPRPRSTTSVGESKLTNASWFYDRGDSIDVDEHPEAKKTGEALNIELNVPL